MAVLLVDASGAVIMFEYKFGDMSVDTASDTTLTNTVTVPTVTLSSAGDYTCTVTVTASGVCGGGGSEPACPTSTSGPVRLTVQCKW